jgi:hypothetical protein
MKSTMASAVEELFCTACGWHGSRAPIGCPECGSSELAAVRGDALVAFPAGQSACAACRAVDRPLVFRGTTRVGSIIWFLRSRRISGYWCERCARKKTAMSLTYTGLLGWWGFFGAFFWTPRATYDNWRAVWLPPRKPLDWGAFPVAELATALAEARASRAEPWSAFDVDDAAAEATP